jgi:Uri superfamily endonuclease
MKNNQSQVTISEIEQAIDKLDEIRGELGKLAEYPAIMHYLTKQNELEKQKQNIKELVLKFAESSGIQQYVFKGGVKLLSRIQRELDLKECIKRDKTFLNKHIDFLSMNIKDFEELCKDPQFKERFGNCLKEIGHKPAVTIP